jgi:hypothetical protein
MHVHNQQSGWRVIRMEVVHRHPQLAAHANTAHAHACAHAHGQEGAWTHTRTRSHAPYTRTHGGGCARTTPQPTAYGTQHTHPAACVHACVPVHWPTCCARLATRAPSMVRPRVLSTVMLLSEGGWAARCGCQGVDSRSTTGGLRAAESTSCTSGRSGARRKVHKGLKGRFGKGTGKARGSGQGRVCDGGARTNSRALSTTTGPMEWVLEGASGCRGTI